MIISQIDSVTPASPSDVLISSALDEPGSDQAADTYRLNVAGWALGRHAPVVRVEIYADRLRLIEAPVSIPRPDIKELYPEVPWSVRAGFRTAVSLLGFPGLFEFRVVVVTSDGHRSDLGTVRSRRAPLPIAPESTSLPQPLLVTTVGRSGSTWFMRLINNHPQVVAHRPFQRDTRVAAYWLGILDTLGNPASYLLPLIPAVYSNPRWWTNYGNVPAPGYVEPELEAWLGRENIEEVASFCRNRVGASYEQIVKDADRKAKYVAEKVSPNTVPYLARDLFPDSLEIILVRDFRDVFCSVIAYTERHGNQHFGRHRAESDEGYVPLLRSSAEDLLQTWRRRGEDAVLVRYEDLVTDPVATVGTLLTGCNLDASDGIAERMVSDSWATTPGELAHRTVDDPARSVGRWRRDLSPSMQAACEDAFGDVLHGFGYE
jgi:hypothetical protein